MSDRKWQYLVTALVIAAAIYVLMQAGFRASDGADIDAPDLGSARVAQSLVEVASGTSREQLEGDRSQLVIVEVLDARDDSPLKDAEVVLSRAGMAEQFLVDERGQHAFQHEVVNDAELMVRAPRFFSEARSPGKVREQLEREGILKIRLLPCGQLSVRVIDEDGTPIPLARVNVLPGDAVRRVPNREDFPHFWPTFVGAFGYSPDLVSEKYVLSWTKQDGELLLDSLPCGIPLFVEADQVAPPTSEVITIPMTEGYKSVTLTALRAALLRGRIRWSHGRAAPDVNVRSILDSGSQGTFARATTDQNGEFVLRGLRFGTAAYVIDAPGEGPRTVQIDRPEVDIGTITLSDCGELVGRVLSECMEHGVGIRLISGFAHQAGKLVTQFTIADEGEYRVRLPHGRYDVQFRAGGVPFARIDARVPGVAPDVDADLLLGRLRLTGASARSGTEAEIRLVHTESLESTIAQAWTTGSVPQGTLVTEGQDLVAWLVPSGSYDGAVRLRSTAPWQSLGSIVIEPGTETAIDLSTLGRSGSIEGVVVDYLHDPLCGMEVEAALLSLESTDRGMLRRRATSSLLGTFVLPDLELGIWSVYLRSRGPQSPERVLVRVLSSGKQAVQLVTGASGSIVGHVRREGTGILGASIRVRPRGAAFVTSTSFDALTDSEGAYRVEGLAPGQYTVLVSAPIPGKCQRGEAINLAPSQVQTIDVDCGCETTEMRVTWHGDPVLDLYEARAYGERGFRALEVDRSLGCVVRGCLEPGRWLLQANRSLHARSQKPPRPGGASLALLEVPATGKTATIVVSLGESSLRVRLRSTASTTSLPDAFLVDVEGMSPDLAPSILLPLAYDDSTPSERVFPYLPAGTRVRLVEQSGSRVIRIQELVLSIEGETLIDWPAP